MALHFLNIYQTMVREITGHRVQVQVEEGQARVHSLLLIIQQLDNPLKENLEWMDCLQVTLPHVYSCRSLCWFYPLWRPGLMIQGPFVLPHWCSAPSLALLDISQYICPFLPVVTSSLATKASLSVPVFPVSYVIATTNCSVENSLTFSSRVVTRPGTLPHILLCVLSPSSFLPLRSTFVKIRANRCLCGVNSLVSEGPLKWRAGILVQWEEGSLF